VIAQWQIDMAARPAPPVRAIVAGSTPVLSFGDPLRAGVATLGINPSSREFIGEDSLLLTGRLRRLATTESIGAEPRRQLTVEQAGAVVEDCNGYFARNPYRRWFGRLDRVLTSALGVGYYAGTACHLDLIQWATDPAWGKLLDPEKRLLLDEGRPHLQRLLGQPNLRVVVLNGRSVIDHVTQLRLCALREVAWIARDRDTRRLLLGQRNGVTYVGWTTNLQSSRGVSRRFLDELTGTAATLVGGLGAMPEPVPSERAPQQSSASTGDRAYLPLGLTVTSKDELADVLTAWLRDSDAPTIGDPGRYGGGSGSSSNWPAVGQS